MSWQKILDWLEKAKSRWETIAFFLAWVGGIVLPRITPPLYDWLPLPRELFWWRGLTIASFCGVVFGLISVNRAVAIRTGPAPAPNSISLIGRMLGQRSTPLVQLLVRALWLAVLFVLMCFVFELVEHWWKNPSSWPPGEIIYWWIEPLVFGIACGVLVAVLVFLLSAVWHFAKSP